MYGSMMLLIPFYKMMRHHINNFGWNIMGSVYGTGLLDLPPPWILWRQYQQNGRFNEDVVLRAAFPFMLFVGALMVWFFISHAMLIADGYTTLEHMSRPNPSRESTIITINPFDQGWKKNFKQIFGVNILYMFFPWPNHIPDPFVPKPKYS